MARLVLNHSTNLNGLIKWLKILSAEETIQTITPACISKTKNNGGQLSIRITRKTNEGYKLVARKGQLAQEIYLVTKLTEKSIDEMIKNSNPNRSHKKRV